MNCMSNHAYDVAVESLEDDFEEGLITPQEYAREMRQLNAALREAQRKSVKDAYDDFY